MPVKIVNRLTASPVNDFRARATLGVALSALTLLLPFAIGSFVFGNPATAIGTLGIVTILAVNALSVIRRQDYQRLTLYGLVPAGMVFMTQVFHSHGVVGALWCYPSILACYCMLDQGRAWVANGIILGIAVPMSALTLDPWLAARVFATLMAVSVFAVIVVRAIDEQQRLLHRQIRIDALTGLLNRASLHDTLAAAMQHRDLHRSPPALLALDLDHFKRVNDTLGHEAGDRVLCGISAILIADTPSDASVFRLGGEEFLILLAGCDATEPEQIAERLRREVSSAAARLAGRRMRAEPC